MIEQQRFTIFGGGGPPVRPERPIGFVWEGFALTVGLGWGGLGSAGVASVGGVGWGVVHGRLRGKRGQPFREPLWRPDLEGPF